MDKYRANTNVCDASFIKLITEAPIDVLTETGLRYACEIGRITDDDVKTILLRRKKEADLNWIVSVIVGPDMVHDIHRGLLISQRLGYNFTEEDLRTAALREIIRIANG